MILLGDYNTLEILRVTEPGIFLGDKDGNEVLLPNRYIPEAFDIGDQINVFVYLDNDERPVAVTDQPYITKDNFALLRCNDVNKHGAFLDWGLVKELFCPFKEQAFKMQKGQWYLVCCYLDESSDRLVASSKTNRFLSNDNLSVAEYDEVDLVVSHPSEIGWYVIVNKMHLGLVYKDQIFQDINVGDQLKGLVQKIRPGNKLDVALGQFGYRSLEPNAELLLNAIEDHGGFLELTDKSDPEEIREVMQMSKKSFKKAIGNLYKSRLISIESNGLKLVKK